MLVRIVRLRFTPDTLDDFLQEFDDQAPHIRAFPGCEHLELWRDVDTPATRTTYSLWTSEEALEAYRSSKLFRSTWSSVKPLFDAPPEAHTYVVTREATTIEQAASESLEENDS